MNPVIAAFFDTASNTVSYLVHDPATRLAAVIDPVLDYEPGSGVFNTSSAQTILDAAALAGLQIAWVLETHVHADHLSAAHWIAGRTGASVGIGEHVRDVQAIFVPMFAADDVSADGSAFDRLFADEEVFALGKLQVRVLHTPGHTPACVAYVIGDAVFVGDTLFMPDFGTARADFPGGNARTLYRSIRRVLALPPDTRVFVCHDYKAPGRESYAWETTIAQERAHNAHVHDGVSEDEFVAKREARDRTLSAPALLHQSIQVNIRAGQLPPPDGNGVRYLRVPISMHART